MQSVIGSEQKSPVNPGLHVHTLDVDGPTTLVVHVPCGPHSDPPISQFNIISPQSGPIGKDYNHTHGVVNYRTTHQ